LSAQIAWRTVAAGATIHADEASHWDNLEARFLTRRINHSVEYSTPESNTRHCQPKVQGPLTDAP